MDIIHGYVMSAERGITRVRRQDGGYIVFATSRTYRKGDCVVLEFDPLLHEVVNSSTVCEWEARECGVNLDETPAEEIEDYEFDCPWVHVEDLEE